MKEELAAFPRTRVAALADVSERRLDYWERTGLIEPTVNRRVTPHRTTRLYDYGDVLSVLVIVELLAAGVSLQHIRQIVLHLREQNFRPSEVVFALAGSSVIFQADSGDWEDIRQKNQIVIHQVLDLEPIRARIRRGGQRRRLKYGKTEKRRGALGSKALIAGTRIPVESVIAYLDRGYKTAEILAAYPDLVKEDVAAIRRLASA